ncbi:hypothetical protein [Nocardioides sp.]|uniref:hypothetical protein n=1 Tax=Nocardioides sp. TaxID=35761 RepID=UPI002615EEB7|nr:hypothetical protein [Nocardioides sp.]
MSPVATSVHAARTAGIAIVRTLHRLSVEIDAPLPDGPVLFVANHGFGSLFDLTVYAAFAAIDDLRPGRGRPSWSFLAGSWAVPTTPPPSQTSASRPGRCSRQSLKSRI